MALNGTENILQIITLVESFVMFSLLLVALIFFSQIFYHHIISSKYSEKTPSMFVVIYIITALIFISTSLVHTGYLLALWYPTGELNLV